MNLIFLFLGEGKELASEPSKFLHLLRSGKTRQIEVKEPKFLTRSMEGCGSGEPAVPIAASQVRRYVDHWQSGQLRRRIKGQTVDYHLTAVLWSWWSSKG